jgi:hypothetical protein
MEDTGSIRDFKVLKFLDRFKGYFEKTGVNYPIMRRFLQIMLIMDGRRSITAVANQAASRKKADGSPFTGYMMSYGLLGIFIMMLMIVPFSLFYKMSIILGMIIFMIMTTMISDFSAVLLDVRDKIILTPRPIDSKTLNMAKTLHILVYISTITAIIAGPSLIVGLIKYGLLFALIFIVQLFFIAAFVIFFTSILYFLILQFFDSEKLRDVINYFQIILSIAMTIGYQFIGRAFNMLDTKAVFIPRWWTYLLPSVWFAGPYSVIMENNHENAYIVLSILSILIPAILFVLYSAKVSPYFEKSLQKLAVVNEKKANIIEKRGRLKKKLTAIICPDRDENIFYRFAKNMVSNERQLKLKMYPSLAYAVIFPFIFILSSSGRGRSIIESIGAMSKYPMYLGVYVTAILLSVLFTLIYTSEKYKGAWIYRILPIKNPSPLFKGALKCFITKYVFPIFTFMGLLFLMVNGPAAIPHIAVIFINFLIITAVNFKINEKSLPFSKDFIEQQKSGNGCLIYITTAIYCGISALIQYYIARFNFYFLYGYMAVLLITLIIIWNRSFKVEWNQIE